MQNIYVGTNLYALDRQHILFMQKVNINAR